MDRNSHYFSLLKSAFAEIKRQLRLGKFHTCALAVLAALPLAFGAFALCERLLLPGLGEWLGVAAAAGSVLLGLLAGNLLSARLRRAEPATAEALWPSLAPYLSAQMGQHGIIEGLTKVPDAYDAGTHHQARQRWRELHERGYPKADIPKGPSALQVLMGLGLSLTSCLAIVLAVYRPALDLNDPGAAFANIDPANPTLPLVLLAAVAVWFAITLVSLLAAATAGFRVEVIERPELPPDPDPSATQSPGKIVLNHIAQFGDAGARLISNTVSQGETFLNRLAQHYKKRRNSVAKHRRGPNHNPKE